MFVTKDRIGALTRDINWHRGVNHWVGKQTPCLGRAICLSPCASDIEFECRHPARGGLRVRSFLAKKEVPFYCKCVMAGLGVSMYIPRECRRRNVYIPMTAFGGFNFRSVWLLTHSID